MVARAAMPLYATDGQWLGRVQYFAASPIYGSAGFSAQVKARRGKGGVSMSCRFVRGARSLRLALAFLAGLMVSGATGTLAAVGDVPDPLVGLQIEDAVQAGDTARALALIDAALGTATDPRFTADLLARKAEILSSEGRHAEAAVALELHANTIAECEGDTLVALRLVLDKAAVGRE